MLHPFLPQNPEHFPCLPNNKHWFCDFFHEQEELMGYEDLTELENFRKYHERLKEKFDVMSKDSESVEKPLFVIFETPCNIYQGHEKICTDPFSSDNLLSTQHLNFYTNLLSVLYSGTLPATLRKARESVSRDEFDAVLTETMEKYSEYRFLHSFALTILFQPQNLVKHWEHCLKLDIFLKICCMKVKICFYHIHLRRWNQKICHY
jgi:hypothetical protein